MKAFLDTSVLIAAFYADHQFHVPSIELFLRHKKNEASCGAHTLAEIYGSLTGRTGRDRAGTHEALLFLEDVRERLTIITLDEHEYFKAVKESSVLGITGGAIYDAILGHCALKSKAQTIYTWNTKDFIRLGEQIAEKTKTPTSL